MEERPRFGAVREWREAGSLLDGLFVALQS